MAALFSAFAIWASFPCVVTPAKEPGGPAREEPRRRALGARSGILDVCREAECPALAARIVRDLREIVVAHALQPAVIGRGPEYGQSPVPTKSGPHVLGRPRVTGALLAIRG
ncbi:hypothetical protein GCM10027039_11910 [Terrabacter koreensis]